MPEQGHLVREHMALGTKGEAASGADVMTELRLGKRSFEQNSLAEQNLVPRSAHSK